MKTLQSILISMSACLVLFSCGNSISSQESTSKGFSIIEKEIKTQFGEKAYYTDLVISYEESIGNMVSTTVTQDPESLKMGEWTCIQGRWKQTSEVTLEVTEGARVADFMFQLNDNISLTKLGKLIEKSKEKLKKAENIESPMLDRALIKYPDNGDASRAEYVIQLKDNNGEKTFNYSYTINGDELLK